MSILVPRFTLLLLLLAPPAHASSCWELTHLFSLPSSTILEKLNGVRVALAQNRFRISSIPEDSVLGPLNKSILSEEGRMLRLQELEIAGVLTFRSLWERGLYQRIAETGQEDSGFDIVFESEPEP